MSPPCVALSDLSYLRIRHLPQNQAPDKELAETSAEPDLTHSLPALLALLKNLSDRLSNTNSSQSLTSPPLVMETKERRQPKGTVVIGKGAATVRIYPFTETRTSTGSPLERICGRLVRRCASRRIPPPITARSSVRMERTSCSNRCRAGTASCG